MTRFQRFKTKLLIIQAAYLDLSNKQMDEVDALLAQIIELIDNKIPVPAETAEPIMSVETDEGWIKGRVEVTVYEAKKETWSMEEWEAYKQSK
jgi:hypothetical protein